ncbi:adaptin ear-binding coat-associated protein 2-like isoform X2 [Lampetra fluviatilis]
MRITAKGTAAFVKLEDKASGELFAQAPVDAYPGLTVESVKDSSRYFVLRIQDGGAGRSAFIGIGFADRGDAFDFSVTLQDHFKWVKQESELAKQLENPDTTPKLDLGFKEGETIKLNIGHMKKKEGGAGGGVKPRGSGSILLPPPPGGQNPPPRTPTLRPHTAPPPPPPRTGICWWSLETLRAPKLRQQQQQQQEEEGTHQGPTQHHHHHHSSSSSSPSHRGNAWVQF